MYSSILPLTLPPLSLAPPPCGANTKPYRRMAYVLYGLARTGTLCPITSNILSIPPIYRYPNIPTFRPVFKVKSRVPGAPKSTMLAYLHLLPTPHSPLLPYVYGTHRNPTLTSLPTPTPVVNTQYVPAHKKTFVFHLWATNSCLVGAENPTIGLLQNT